MSKQETEVVPFVEPVNEAAEITAGFSESLVSMGDFLQLQNPSLALFIGNSSVLSQDICRSALLLPRETETRRLATSVPWYYGTPTPLLNAHLQDVEAGTKIVVVDEFIESGRKADYVLDALRDLGFEDATFAAFVGSRYMNGDKFVGSTNASYLSFMKEFAKTVSRLSSVKDVSPYQKGLATKRRNELRRKVMSMAGNHVIDMENSQ